MIKGTLLLLSVLLLSGASIAQKSPLHPIQAENTTYAFGARGGLTISTISHQSTDENYDVESKRGVHLGFLFHLPAGRNLAIQPEIGYSPQGFIRKGYDPFGNFNYEVKERLGYLNLPIMVKYFTDNGLFLQSGPQVGLNMNGGYEGFKTFDLSWSFGAGYISRSGLGVDVRYNTGLIKIDNNDNAFPGYATEAKNQVFQFSVLYVFAIVKSRKTGK